MEVGQCRREGRGLHGSDHGPGHHWPTCCLPDEGGKLGSLGAGGIRGVLSRQDEIVADGDRHRRGHALKDREKHRAKSSPRVSESGRGGVGETQSPRSQPLLRETGPARHQLRLTKVRESRHRLTLSRITARPASPRLPGKSLWCPLYPPPTLGCPRPHTPWQYKPCQQRLCYRPFRHHVNVISCLLRPEDLHTVPTLASRESEQGGRGGRAGWRRGCAPGPKCSQAHSLRAGGPAWARPRQVSR